MKTKNKHIIYRKYKFKISYLIGLIFLLSTWSVQAQEIDKKNSKEKPIFIEETNPQQSNSLFSEKKVNTQVQMGCMLSANNKGGYNLSTYLSPRISFQLSPRLQISTGITAVHSQGSQLLYAPEIGAYYQQNPGLSSFVTLQGIYQLKEKLHIYGEVNIGQMQNIQLPFSNEKNENIQSQAQLYRLGLHYQIGKNASIQVEMKYSKNRPYPYSNMNSGLGQNNFNNQLFFRP